MSSFVSTTFELGGVPITVSVPATQQGRVVPLEGQYTPINIITPIDITSTVEFDVDIEFDVIYSAASGSPLLFAERAQPVRIEAFDFNNPRRTYEVSYRGDTPAIIDLDTINVERHTERFTIVVNTQGQNANVVISATTLVNGNARRSRPRRVDNDI